MSAEEMLFKTESTNESDAGWESIQLVGNVAVTDDLLVEEVQSQ